MEIRDSRFVKGVIHPPQYPIGPSRSSKASTSILCPYRVSCKSFNYEYCALYRFLS
jgi:hypothetical protein